MQSFQLHHLVFDYFAFILNIILSFFLLFDLAGLKDARLENDRLAELLMIVVYISELFALIEYGSKRSVLYLIVENVQHTLQFRLDLGVASVKGELEPIELSDPVNLFDCAFQGQFCTFVHLFLLTL